MKNIIFTILFFISFLSYGQNILSNGTFTNADGWTLLNGSTATGGTLTVVANGPLNFDTPNWVAQYENVLNNVYYETRKYRLTFDARQTSGIDNFQSSTGFATFFDQQITSSFVTYTVDFDGNVANHRNNLVFGGATSGDTFEVQNVTLEIIGDVTNPNVPGEPSQVIFFTDFEPGTYPYQQWGANGANPSELNQWEVDHGDPRTTATVGSPLTFGRDGTGTAIWLGAYNGDPTRDEVGRDELLPFGEQWIAFSVYPDENLPDTRLFFQVRCLAPGGTSTVNALSLRSRASTGEWYFSLADDVTRVDQTEATLGGWNGAGTGTSSVYFDYNFQQWNDIVIHYKGAFGAAYTGPDTSTLAETFGYDPRSDGFIEIWVNGVKIVDHVGTTLYRYERNGGEIRIGFTPKIGPYWSDLTAQGEYYYDNFKVWAGPNGSYANVDPSGSGISAGYTVNLTSGLTTTEAGGTDTFTVVLDSQPTTDVVFDITSNDTSEGTVSSSSLTFTNANWNTAQTITVTGVDDAIDDGNVAYTVTVSVNAASSDDDYDALADVTVDLTNTDDDGGAEPSPSTGKRVKKGKFILIDY
ncbi:hypothetical protein [Flagellimonas sp.]|uniref:hypothetical protein n=1 Tax=Flagellimonas sp. TaxID=2058762 RepID=UPI003BA84637